MVESEDSGEHRRYDTEELQCRQNTQKNRCEDNRERTFHRGASIGRPGRDGAAFYLLKIRGLDADDGRGGRGIQLGHGPGFGMQIATSEMADASNEGNLI